MGWEGNGEPARSTLLRHCTRGNPQQQLGATKVTEPFLYPRLQYLRVARRSGEASHASVTGFLRRRLKLKVNVAKSAVARPQDRKFLGFSFTGGREAKRRIAPRALLPCRPRVRELARRTRGISLEQMTKQLATYLRGWKSYFGFSQTPSPLQKLEAWMRRRLRSVIWKQWKRSKVQFEKLRQRNIRPALGSNRWQSAWPLASGHQSGFAVRASGSLLRFARSSTFAGRALAQPN